MASGQDCQHIDEHRYAEVSRVMAKPGGDWLVPHLNGAVYSDKPPVFFWAAAAAQRLGVALPLAAFLPSVLGAVIAMLATAGIARRLLGTPADLAAAAVLATSSLFSSMAGRANLDAFLTGWITLGIFLWVRGAEESERGGRGARLFGALACLSAGVGVLVKGPVALAIPGVAIALSLVLEGRARSLASRWTAAALALALLPAGLWILLAGLREGLPYVQTLVFHHGVGHPFGLVLHKGPWYAYGRMVPRVLLPWSLLLPAAFVALPWPLRRPLARRDALPIAWLVGGYVMLSAFPAKRQHYLLPLLPGAALLLARLFSELLREGTSGPSAGAVRLRNRLAELACGALAAAGVAGGLLAIASAAAALLAIDLVPSLPASLPSRAVWVGLWSSVLSARVAYGAAMAALGAAALAGGLAAWRGSVSRRAVGLAVLAAAWALFQARVLAPALEPGLGTRAFVERAAQIAGDAPLADYGGINFTANWVLQRDVVPVLGNSRAATRFMARHAEQGAYLMVQRKLLEKRGMPEGAQVVLEWPRTLESDLLLLGPAPAPER